MSSYWSQPTLDVLPSETRGSDRTILSKYGTKEIWSSITYALTAGDQRSVKILILETSSENHRRLVGPTFHTPQEAQQFVLDNPLAWPGDKEPLSLARVRKDGLLKAWSQVWSKEIETCILVSAESVHRFVENFNMTSSMHVRVPKTFADQLIIQIHKEENADINPKYQSLARGYFFPDRPSDDSDGSDMPDTPIHRRVHGFTSLIVNIGDQEIRKFGFVRSRIRADQYFIAATPDYAYDDVDQLKIDFAENLEPFPDFDFDAKWMLQEELAT